MSYILGFTYSFVKALVMGEPMDCSREDADRKYLFDIVANKRNSVDVDKFDYLARDCFHVGFKIDMMTNRCGNIISVRCVLCESAIM